MRISTEKGIRVIKGILIEFGSEVEKKSFDFFGKFFDQTFGSDIFRK